MKINHELLIKFIHVRETVVGWGYRPKQKVLSIKKTVFPVVNEKK